MNNDQGGWKGHSPSSSDIIKQQDQLITNLRLSSEQNNTRLKTEIRDLNMEIKRIKQRNKAIKEEKQIIQTQLNNLTNLCTLFTDTIFTTDTNNGARITLLKDTILEINRFIKCKNNDNNKTLMMKIK